jgi:hypothetical protein
MELALFRHIFEKYSNIKLHENFFSGIQVVPCGWKDRRTDMTKLILALAILRTRLKVNKILNTMPVRRNIGCEHDYSGEESFFFMELHIACTECRSAEIQTKKRKTASRIQYKNANH